MYIIGLPVKTIVKRWNSPNFDIIFLLSIPKMLIKCTLLYC